MPAKSEIRNQRSEILKALAVIPARYGSTRFPGKPLAAETGKPLIQHVVENARRATRIERILVATDDPRIFDAVTAFGGEAVMTGEHPNGTSRIAEAILKFEVRNSRFEIILNVQGDEPEIAPATIDSLVEGLARDESADMATLYSPFGPDEDPANPNIVKVIKDQHDRAIYFSRSLIPYVRDAANPKSEIRRLQQRRMPLNPKYFKHPGLYAYRREFLLKYPTLSPTPLEQAEKLEQLRVIEHGYRIALIRADAPHPGIDTPQQYAAFVRRMKEAAARKG